MANMAQPANYSAQYGDLKRFAQNQEYERALKIANKIYHECPKDETAFHCKVVCLIKLDRFEDALKIVQKAPDFESLVTFEKAYCQYRLNHTQNALATLRSVKELDNRSSELLAQVLYRLENYGECYELYRKIIQNSEDDFDEERETNLSAVLASRQLWDGVDMEDPGLEERSFELCYNMACYYIGRGDFVEAEKKLKKAEAFCRKMFEDDPDATEEEVDDEVAIIRVQLALVQQNLGKKDEAMQIYNQVLKKKPSDLGVNAVASNNIVTLNKDQNVFDSKKKMKIATGDNLQHKLTKKQKTSINVNQCLLHLYTNQGAQCHQLAASLIQEFPDIDVPVLIEAAQYVREKDSKSAFSLLEKFAAVNPSQAVNIKLAMVQLSIMQGSVYQACDLLKSLGDLQYRLGVVSALVTLYMSQEDKTEASNVLIKAVEWYSKQKPESEELLTLIRANASFQMKNGSPEQAAKMLEKLHKSNPDDHQVLAQLITAYSQFDPVKAQKASKDLPSVTSIAKNVDVDALEAAFSTLGPKYMKRTQKGDTQPSPGPTGDMIIQKSKRKRKKKGKLPKNLDAEIDPERWIPRKERSYYRGRRKDKKKDIGKGTQGATSPASEEAAKTQGSGSEASSPRPGTAASPPSGASGLPQGPRQQKPAQAQKKKKKKGGNKW